MTSTEKRGKTTREAVLTYCTSWTQALYRDCWPERGAGDATTETMEETSLAVEREMMAMLRHEIPEQDDTASASEPMREPTVLEITGDLGSDSEPEIMAGSFLGTYGELDIDTTGHWTYRAGETRLRELKENGPDFIHYDRFFVTREDGSGQRLRIVLSRCRNDKVKETKANMFDDGRVPAESGEDNETILRLAASRDFIRKLPDPDPDPFGEPAPVRLWVEGRPGDDMPPREVTQDELRHLRLYPERDELSGGGLRFEGLLFFNAAERLPGVETKEAGDDETKEAGVEEVHSGSHSSKSETRSKLKLWLEGLTKTPVLTKTQCLKAAQIKFSPTSISMNMLNKAWRDAKLPKTWRQQGRRPGT